MAEEIILGLNVGQHDASACLLQGDKILCMVEQDKISQIKRATGLSPKSSVAACLAFTGIAAARVQTIAAGTDLKRLIAWRGCCEEDARELNRLVEPAQCLPDEFRAVDHDIIIEQFPHHLAHAASTAFCANWPSCAVLVVDNRGEDASISMYAFRRHLLTELRSYPVTASLGLLYRLAAQYAGLCGPARDVGKFMGLASYGEIRQKELFDSLDSMLGDLEKHASQWSGERVIHEIETRTMSFFTENFFPYEAGLRRDTFVYRHFAAFIQAYLERKLLGYVRECLDLAGSKRLALAGGVALNCTANRKIADICKGEVFIQPASHDAGVALGAAILARHTATTVQFPHAYWGIGYSEHEWLERLRCFPHLRYHRYDCPEKLNSQIVERLTTGVIGSLFLGRAEIGPRALGNRSIIADPRRRSILERVNGIKGREMWRPLAPMILEEHFDRFFEGTPNPFMVVAATVRDRLCSRIPVNVHTDCSARPQTVSQRQNFFLHNLISAFYHATGIPVLMNTSLNGPGRPIVHDPIDAMEFLAGSELDFIATESLLIEK